MKTTGDDPTSKKTDPKSRFLASMKLDYEKWHDGIGYDLEALRAVPPNERPEIETILIDHRPRDWRDIEALAELDSQRARKTIEHALKDRDPQVRREAMRHAAERSQPTERESLLIRSLQSCALFGGLSQALEEAEEFHPPAVIDALLQGALDRDGEAAVHFAALLYFLHGKAAEPFDWKHRPFFLRFNTTDRQERMAAFRDLCAAIKVDPQKYLP
jgi:hypothetical protein